MASIIENLFSHGKEIQEVLNTYSDRKQAVKEIMKLYPEISNSENAIASNLTQFKVLYPVFSEMQSELACIKQELESLNIVNSELNKVKQDNEKLASANCLLTKENNKLKTENEKLSANNSLIMNELNIVKQIPINEQEGLFEMETTNNEIQQLKAQVTELKDLFFKVLNKTELPTQTHKEKSLKVGAWNVVKDYRGFYRIHRKINNRLIGIYIGRQFSDELAIKKIQERNLPLA